MLGTHLLKWTDPTDGEDPVLWTVSGSEAHGQPSILALFSQREEAESYAESKEAWEHFEKWDLYVNPLVLNRRERWRQDQLWVVGFEDSKRKGNFPEVFVWAVFAFRDDAARYHEHCATSVGRGGVIYKLGLTLWHGSETLKPWSATVKREE